ncbi:MAG TPA: hypothetical protein VGO48_09905 [Conexibacter sp.]|jgi:hypothetical protein|nr:hypothetical protein [Conexibacter sp.]
MRATTGQGDMRRRWTFGLAALASLALLAALLAAPASALKRYRTPGYQGRTHLPKGAHQPALPGSKPVSLSPAGRFPDTLVDDAGTSHIVWTEDDGPNADVVRYCRLRRAATSCDNPAGSQRLIWSKTYEPGDDPQFNVDQDGPRILQLGDTLVILSYRYPTVAAKPDGSDQSRTVLAWVSDDGGESFSGPAIVGTGDINGGAVPYGPSDDPTLLTITQTTACGTCIQAIRPGQFASAQLDLGAGHPDSAYSGTLALDRGTPTAAFADLNRTTFVRRLTNGGAPMSDGSWTPPVTVGGDEPVLAGGPAGAFLLNRPVFGGPFVVRNVAGGAIGKATTVSDKDDAALPDLFEDPSGRLLAGWVTRGGRSPGVRLRTSTGGTSWTPAQSLLSGANAGQLAIGATVDGGGAVALNTTGGINSFGPIAAVPVGPRTPTRKPGLGSRPGGGDPNATAGCQQITFGVVKITTQAGCFWKGSGKDAAVSFTTGELDFNGLKIVPDPGARIMVDARQHTLDTIGSVRALVRSSLTGDVVLWHGPLSVRLPTAISGVPFSFPTGSFSAELKGFPIEGRIDVYLTNRGVRIPISLKLPPYLGGVSGQAELVADSATGLHLESIVIDVPEAPIGPVILRGIHIEYDGAGERWSGAGALLLPPQPGGARLDMAIVFDHGAFDSGELRVTPPFPPGISVGPGVFLTQIGGGVALNPLALSLSGQFGALPVTPRGPFTATVDGRGTVRFGDPLTFTFDGTGSLLDIALSHEHFEVNANGYATLRAGMQFDLGIVGGTGEGEATVDAPAKQFLASLHGNVTLVGQSFVDAQALASNSGIAGCYELTFISLGFGYRWGDTVPEIMFPSCDLSAYKPAPGGTPPPGQVVTGSSFTVKSGTPTISLRVDGNGGVPAVELLAPDSPLPISPVMLPGDISEDTRAISVQTGPQQITVGLPHPTAGTWKVLPLANVAGAARARHGARAHAAAVAGIQVASGLEPPTVSARVGGRGRTRTLSYRGTARPGLTVTFLERGRGGTRALGKPRNAGRGTVRFTTGDLPGGKRTIVALLAQDGVPRLRRTVASYVAPKPPRPGRVAKLAVRHAGGAVAVRWSRSPNAAGYLVRVAISDGRKLAFVLGAGKRSLRIRRVAARYRVTVSVAGRTRAGQLGPPRRVRR